MLHREVVRRQVGQHSTGLRTCFVRVAARQRRSDLLGHSPTLSRRGAVEQLGAVDDARVRRDEEEVPLRALHELVDVGHASRLPARLRESRWGGSLAVGEHATVPSDLLEGRLRLLSARRIEVRGKIR